MRRGACVVLVDCVENNRRSQNERNQECTFPSRGGGARQQNYPDAAPSGNCSGTNTYAYDADAVEQIFTALQIELDQARKRFSENGRPGRKRFSLSQAPMPDTVSYPHITLPLPDGTHLRAVAYADTTYPAINLYLLRDGEPKELVCFAEYNSEHSPCHELCIGVYTSDAEDTQYYGPYRPERETKYGKCD